jgi:tetratricopeptide (TPR) repeat protein
MPKKASARKRLTLREQRDLDVEIGFMEGIIKKAPKYVDALQVLGDAYTRRGKFADGLKVDEQLSALRPGDPTVLYNLACSYSLIRRYEDGISALARAIDRGYKDFRWLMKDPDLASLRQHPLFKTVQEKIRRVKIKVR